MLSIIEKYQITTLCKPDIAMIERTKEDFKKTIRQILEENTELIGRIRTGYMGEGKPHTIELREHSIPVCRLAWKIIGESRERAGRANTSRLFNNSYLFIVFR